MQLQGGLLPSVFTNFRVLVNEVGTVLVPDATQEILTDSLWARAEHH